MFENTINSQMVYLSIGELFPHPDNPRRELGDLTELADSIKQNGVLQNLTVVPRMATSEPCQQGYTVIIGHRRLAAAKLAGLSELPCVIMEMTEKEQIQTMLVENMQRSDLTVYEEAQGFQMMLDLGETVETIAEKSGFSQSTVRRRVKLLDLDKDKFKRAESRGATLEDYAALDKVKNTDAKNQVLDTIGTPNFQNELKKALAEQRYLERRDEWLNVIKTFAVENANCEVSTHKYICNYGRWNLSAEVKIPDDADKVKYYYKVSSIQIDIYRDKDDAREDAERAKREEERRQNEKIGYEFESITSAHFELRSEFVKGLSNAVCKKHMKEISSFAMKVLWLMSSGGYTHPKIDAKLCASCLNGKIEGDLTDDEFSLEDETGFVSASESMPEKLILCMVYSAADERGKGYWCRNWKDGKFAYGHKENEMLTSIYELLEALGYEVSDEETLMRTGYADIFELYCNDDTPAMESNELDEKDDNDFDDAIREKLKDTVGDVDGV